MVREIGAACSLSGDQFDADHLVAAESALGQLGDPDDATAVVPSVETGPTRGDQPDVQFHAGLNQGQELGVGPHDNAGARFRNIPQLELVARGAAHQKLHHVLGRRCPLALAAFLEIRSRII